MSETISVHNMFSPGLSLEFSCIELVFNEQSVVILLVSWCKNKSFWQRFTSGFEGTEEILLFEKTCTNEITGFLPLPSKNDNYKLMVNSVCNLCLFTVEIEGKRLMSKRLMSCQKWYFSNLSTDDMTNEDYLRWEHF